MVGTDSEQAIIKIFKENLVSAHNDKKANETRFRVCGVFIAVDKNAGFVIDDRPHRSYDNLM